MDRKLALRIPAAAILGMAMIFFAAASSMAGEPAAAEETPASSMADFGRCSELVALLGRLEEKNSREFREIKRDIAALSQQAEEPGMSEILGGIGYILGLFGVAAYVASRRKAGGGGAE